MKGFWNRILPFFGQAPTPVQPVLGDAPEVDAQLQALVTGGRVPGLAIGAYRNGKPLLVKGYGYASLEDQTPTHPESTVFRIASVSKPITATALARMADRGLIRLDDPLSTYVPEYPHGDIRIDQLAAHTAGLRAYRGKEYALNRPMSIADSLELFREDPLQFSPGKGFLYNSFDFVLLSLAMERAAGMPFHQLVEQEVLRPLAMDQTTMEVPGAPVPGQAHFYTRRKMGFSPAIAVDNRFKLAGGGYLSTVDDLCRLGQACLDGRAIPASVLDRFWTSREVAGEPTWYGLGWQVSRDAAGRSFVGHVGNAVGGYSNFYLYPELDAVIVILMNCSDPGIQAYLDTLIDQLLHH